MIQVYLLVRELVFWGKAIVIYPLCQTNLYAVSETGVYEWVDGSVCILLHPHSSTKQMENFSYVFNGSNLVSVLSAFSPPISLGEYLDPAQFDSKQKVGIRFRTAFKISILSPGTTSPDDRVAPQASPPRPTPFLRLFVWRK